MLLEVAVAVAVVFEVAVLVEILAECIAVVS